MRRHARLDAADRRYPAAVPRGGRSRRRHLGAGRGWALRFGLTAPHSHRVTNPVLAGIGRRTAEEILADREFAV